MKVLQYVTSVYGCSIILTTALTTHISLMNNAIIISEAYVPKNIIKNDVLRRRINGTCKGDSNTFINDKISEPRRNFTSLSVLQKVTRPSIRSLYGHRLPESGNRDSERMLLRRHHIVPGQTDIQK